MNHLVNIIKEQKDITLVNIATDLLLDAYFIKGEYGNAIETAESIIENSGSMGSEYLALYTLFDIYQQELKDDRKSTEILGMLKERYPNHEFTLMAQVEMGEEVNWTRAIQFEDYESERSVLAKTIVLPKQYVLRTNYPNPFNPVTTIKYDLVEGSFVELMIYDILGRQIRVLIEGNEEAGYKNVIWNGKDSYGNPVASGMYLYRLDAMSYESNKEFHQTRKMILLR